MIDADAGLSLEPIRWRMWFAPSLIALALAGPQGAAPSSSPSPSPEAQPTPFFDARKHPTRYLGPGRDAPEPQGLSEVRLAYFGPAQEDHPEWGQAWRGANLALEEANAGGGYRRLPFRLLSAWSDNPWGSGVADLTRLVFDSQVWAIVGGVDGTTTHLAEQIVVKVGVPLVSPGNTDLSVNMTNVAWTFTCLPTDDQQLALVAALLAQVKDAPFVTLATTDHDARATLSAYRAALGARAPALHVDLAPGALEAADVAARVVAARPHAALIVAGARDAGHLVRALRGAGFEGAIFGSATLGRRAFLVEARGAAEGVVVPLLYEPSPAWDAFAQRFRRRFGVAPDDLAGETYDAVNLTVAAIRRGGLNRVRILEALRALAPWPGVTGTHDWDLTGRNRRPAGLAQIRGGRLVPLPAPRP